jgi:Ca2+-binding RTX toxin-like protein
MAGSLILQDLSPDHSAGGIISMPDYTGPVAGLQSEYIGITSDNLVLAPLTPNVFLHTGDGTDVITLSSGNNVVDAGGGSNFLTAGSGIDTFFVDARNTTSDTWSTVKGFHGGDTVTVWGLTPQDFNLGWMDGQGANGSTGATLHATADGKPTASVTLAGFSLADFTSGKLQVSFGGDAASGSPYLSIHATS